LEQNLNIYTICGGCYIEGTPAAAGGRAALIERRRADGSDNIVGECHGNNDSNDDADDGHNGKGQIGKGSDARGGVLGSDIHDADAPADGEEKSAYKPE
jgi:hypothetical protein